VQEVDDTALHAQYARYVAGWREGCAAQLQQRGALVRRGLLLELRRAALAPAGHVLAYCACSAATSASCTRARLGCAQPEAAA
jgi:hypothetical protein